MKRIVLTSALIALALTGCSKLTMQNYQKLQTGMTQQEVEALIGSPGSCDETLGIRACTWGDEARNVKANFVAGKLVLMSAHNLK